MTKQRTLEFVLASDKSVYADDVMAAVGIERRTALRYLAQLAEKSLINSYRVGRSRAFIPPGANPGVAKVSDTRYSRTAKEAIVDLLEKGEPMTIAQIAAYVHTTYGYAGKFLYDLAADGKVVQIDTGREKHWAIQGASIERKVYEITENGLRDAVRGMAMHIGGLTNLRNKIAATDGTKFLHIRTLLAAAEACDYELLLVPKS